ncbi:MAG: DUF86 domain-containing protein [Candidatus Pacebacteria bacterium]|nr:DUF86 domain-containing protein [Candidatus Paceibacterota bacterium]
MDNLRKNSKKLKQLKDKVKSFDEYSSSIEILGSTERYLQLGLQSIIDAIHLVIIDMDMSKPEDSHEAVSVLFNKNIVSEDLANKLTKMVGLRNVLVHEYEQIDNHKVYDVLANHLGDLDDFENTIRKYISK